MHDRKYIYDDVKDASINAVIFIISAVIPTVISVSHSENKVLIMAIFVNALSFIKDYLGFSKIKNYTPGYLVKLILGFFSTIAAGIYSVVAFYLLLDAPDVNDIAKKLYLWNCIFSFVVLVPFAISCFELVCYIIQLMNDALKRKDTKKSTIIKARKSKKVANSTTKKV